MKNTMIGSFATDATSVYFQKDHEMYRKWVALMDDEDPDDTGVQGYLKLSIQILGPGDKLKVHDEEAEMKKEQELAKRNGGDDLSSMVMIYLSIPSSPYIPSISSFPFISSISSVSYISMYECMNV